MDLLCVLAGLLAAGLIFFGPWVFLAWIIDKVWD